MTARLLLRMIIVALLIGGVTQTAQADSLPAACDVLQALPASTFAGQALTYETLQDREGNGIRMSMCTALKDDALPAATLLVRQDMTAQPPGDADQQRDDMIAGLTETIGHAPVVNFPDIGEAALWVGEIGQLTVWYRNARVMFIVTADGSTSVASEEQAKLIANAITTTFPD